MIKLICRLAALFCGEHHTGSQSLEQTTTATGAASPCICWHFCCASVLPTVLEGEEVLPSHRDRAVGAWRRYLVRMWKCQSRSYRKRARFSGHQCVPVPRRFISCGRLLFFTGELHNFDDLRRVRSAHDIREFVCRAAGTGFFICLLVSVLGQHLKAIEKLLKKLLYFWEVWGRIKKLTLLKCQHDNPHT